MNLNELESRLQDLIEVRLPGFFPGQKVEERAIQKLAGAMQGNLIVGQGGSTIAPNVYTIIVSPSAAARWQEPRLLETLIGVLKTVVREAGLTLTSQPEITISTDKTLSPNDVSVMASHRIEPVGETQGMSNESAQRSPELDHIPPNAFLIIEGIRLFPLTESVVNIGRRLDNQLVIDDPRVSRNHCQLRAINGRFVLFDLNSTGGTFVNGQRAGQTVLYPGDVISLAGVALIFGQDNPPQRTDSVDTAPLSPHTAERPTALIKEHSTAKIKTKK